MRVLLDECVPRRLGRELVGHEVRTTSEMGWAGKRNGELLRIAAPEFDALLTVDRNLLHQQNLSTFDIAVVVMLATSNTFSELRSMVPKVLEVLPVAPKGRARIVSGAGPLTGPNREYI